MITKILKFLIIVFGLIAFVRCSPQKRLNNLLKKHPSLTNDSIYTIHDTIITGMFSFDTVYTTKNLYDTIFLKQKNVEVKAFYHNDTIYLGATVKPDTIYKTITLPVKRIVQRIDATNRAKWFWIGCAVALLVILILEFTVMYFKR